MITGIDSMKRIFIICALAVCALGQGANKWELQQLNGVATPFHNGRPKLLNILYDNDSWYAKYMGVLSKGIAKDAQLHMHLMHVTVDMGNSPIPELTNMKNGKSVYAVTYERLKKLMEADPDGYVMFRIVCWPPKSWLKHHKAELVQDENGKIAASLFPPASIFSDKFFNSMTVGVKKMVQFLENTRYRDRIIGYQPMTGYSGEWNRASTSPSRIADYSPVAQAAFRNHLLKKYGTIEKINRGLGTAFKANGDIKIPSEKDFVGVDGNFFKTPQEARYTREYLKFNSDTLAQRILDQCKVIKEVNPDRLVGTSYSYWFGEAQGGIRGLLINGHLSWPMLGNSKYIDYILSPPYYALCGPSAPTFNHCLVNSFNLYGKTYLAESDHPTHLICHMNEILAPPIIWTFKMGSTSKGMLEVYKRIRKRLNKLPAEKRSGIDFGKNYRQFLIDADKKGTLKIKPSDRVPTTMSESIANIQRLAVNVVTKPIGGIWWWDMEGAFRKATGGVAYNHPEILKTFRQIAELFKKAVKADRASSSKVAIFYSREALFYAKAGMKRWEYFRDSLPLNLRPLGECGVPFDSYYFEDIEKISNIESYRLLIFVNSHYVTTARREWMNSRLKKNGNVLVWFYGSGYLNENGYGVGNIKALTGIGFKQLDVPEMLASRTVAEAKLLKGIKAGTAFGSFRTTGRKSPLAKPHFVVNDSTAKVLGVSYKRRDPNFAVKKFKNWTSVYLPGGQLPVELLKNLASEAGINVFTDSRDIQIWANKSMLGIYSYPSVKGRRIISVPFSTRTLKDFFSGREFEVKNGKIIIDFNGAATYFFFINEVK
jgi:hypothetical protein